MARVINRYTSSTYVDFSVSNDKKWATEFKCPFVPHEIIIKQITYSGGGSFSSESGFFVSTNLIDHRDCIIVCDDMILSPNLIFSNSKKINGSFDFCALDFDKTKPELEGRLGIVFEFVQY